MKKRSILLADDDEISREIIHAILDDLEGVEIVTASDGRAALEAALSRRFDLLIFDRNMPHISGDRILRHLRASRTANEATPVIRISADANRKDGVVETMGSTEIVLQKPLRGEELLAAVDRLLGNGVS